MNTQDGLVVTSKDEILTAAEAVKNELFMKGDLYPRLIGQRRMKLADAVRQRDALRVAYRALLALAGRPDDPAPWSLMVGGERH